MSARAPILPMYQALVGVGALAGLLIAVVFSITAPVIERNRAEALERAVFAVLPEASTRRTYGFDEAGGLRPVDAAPALEGRLHAAFDEAGRLVGVAIEASGMGYADTISLLYGYAPAREAIVGMRVLASRETPGLGDRIESDPAFLENFEALAVPLNAAGDDLAHSITTVKAGSKTEPWQIDGITGATVSSQAVGEILADSTARWLPRLAGRLDALAPATPDAAAPTRREEEAAP